MTSPDATPRLIDRLRHSEASRERIVQTLVDAGEEPSYARLLVLQAAFSGVFANGSAVLPADSDVEVL